MYVIYDHWTVSHLSILTVSVKFLLNMSRFEIAGLEALSGKVVVLTGMYSFFGSLIKSAGGTCAY